MPWLRHISYWSPCNLYLRFMSFKYSCEIAGLALGYMPFGWLGLAICTMGLQVSNIRDTLAAALPKLYSNAVL